MKPIVYFCWTRRLVESRNIKLLQPEQYKQDRWIKRVSIFNKDVSRGILKLAQAFCALNAFIHLNLPAIFSPSDIQRNLMLYTVIHLKLSLCAINLVQQFNSESKTSKSIVQFNSHYCEVIFLLLTVSIDSVKLHWTCIVTSRWVWITTQLKSVQVLEFLAQCNNLKTSLHCSPYFPPIFI